MIFTRPIRHYALALLALCSPLAQSAERPNILFIVSEDNSEQLGCYGDKDVHTPALDSLAKAGVRYDRAYVPYSVCSPSRAAFLTGLYTRQTGHIGLATHRFAMAKGYKTIPRYFKEAGYLTGFVGKVHINPEHLVTKYVDLQGFKSANFSKTISIEKYAEFADKVFQQAKKEKKPFLCIINYADAHRKFITKSKNGFPTTLVNKDVKPLPWVGLDTPYLRDETRRYLDCMNRLDEGVGQVLEKLDAAGMRDNTLIVYIADHGADFPRGKTTCYEGGVKVPMILSYPKAFPKAKEESGLVSSIDILPTMLTAAGIKVPSQLPGIALQELNKPNGKRHPYIHTFTTGSYASVCFLEFGICDDRYKLVYHPVEMKNRCAISRYKNSQIDPSLYQDHYLTPPKYQLFDLKNDPNEFANLADNPEHAATLKRLTKAMKEFQKEINDPFLDPKKVDAFVAEQANKKVAPSRRGKGTWPHLEWFK